MVNQGDDVAIIQLEVGRLKEAEVIFVAFEGQSPGRDSGGVLRRLGRPEGPDRATLVGGLPSTGASSALGVPLFIMVCRDARRNHRKSWPLVDITLTATLPSYQNTRVG
jgi:hypothetical protein